MISRLRNCNIRHPSIRTIPSRVSAPKQFIPSKTSVSIYAFESGLNLWQRYRDCRVRAPNPHKKIILQIRRFTLLVPQLIGSQ